MRFARHLAAAVLTVAAVVAAGVAWAHAGGAGTQNALAPRDGGPGLRLSNPGDLMQTAVIEAVIMAVVITVSALRRRRHRRRVAG